MPRKKKDPTENIESAPIQPEPKQDPSSASETDSGEGSFTFKIKGGRVDFDRMTEKSKERFRAYMAASDIPIGGPGGDTSFNLGDTEVSTAYAILGNLEAAFAAKYWKIPPEVANSIFSFKPQEIEMLTPPTVRVLSKYSGGWLAKYGDEIALVALLGWTHKARFDAVSQYVAAMKEERDRRNPPADAGVPTGD